MKSTRRTLVLAALLCPLAGQLHADLLHHYKFDETAGPIAADAAGEADGSIGANVTLGEAGRLGTSFRFPAAANHPNSRVTLPAVVVPGVEFTMSAFIYLPQAASGQMHIISGNNGGSGRWSLALNVIAGQTQLLWFHNGGIAGESYYPGFDFSGSLNQWVHVGITRNEDGDTTLYIDGVPHAIGSSTAALAITDIGIGMRPNTAQFQFNGRIDDVRFYDHALTVEEMAALAVENDDTDEDGLPDAWEILHFIRDGEDPVADRETILARQGSEDDSDGDGFSNLIEYLAGTIPSDEDSFPQGDSDFDGMDDGWEWLHFGTLARDGYDDFDGDGSLDLEEYEASQGLLIEYNSDGSVSGVSPFTGSSDPANPHSQPDSDDDGLPDGWEWGLFGSLSQAGDGDFDLDGFDNETELLAGSNPARKANTPDNVGVTTRIAVAHESGIEEYSVTRGVWTHLRRIAPIALGESVFGIASHPDGFLYATVLPTTGAPPGTPNRIIRINPSSGQITTLATRGEGDAAAAGWIGSNPQGIEVGPDGKLYFSTAFGNAGEGVFRLNTDGSGFENFIARSGTADHDNDPETPDESWDLNNARDLQWHENYLYVSARAGFSATGRPVYRFNSDGSLSATVATTLNAPQGLAIEENGLLVASTSAGLNGLYLLDLTAEFPVSPSAYGALGAPSVMDVIDLNGDTYYVAYNTGPGNVGQVIRRRSDGSYSVAVNALPSGGNDLAVFSTTLGGSYEEWAEEHFGPGAPLSGPGEDYDGDGTSNLVEFRLGLDPANGASLFAVTAEGSASTGLVLSWPSAEGISFRVLYSETLSSWTPVTTVTGQPGQDTAAWTAPPAEEGVLRRFYRVEFTP